MKLVLVVNGRIPGPRAHSILTMRTAEALQKLHSQGRGSEVEVWAPQRRGRSGADPEKACTPREWYGLDVDVRVRYLPCLDLVDVLPRAVQRLTSPLLARSFARAVVRRARAVAGEVMFVLRDPALWVAAAGRIVHWAGEIHELPRSPARRAHVRSALERASALWTISASARSYLVEQEHIGGEIGVLPCACTERFLRAAAGPDEGGAERPGRPRVTYAGHLYGWKDPARLVATAARLPGVTLRVVGGFPADVCRLRRALRSDNVEFAGFIPPAEVPRELRAADAVLTTLDPKAEKARWFTSPLKVVEALAVGTPLVAPDLPTIRELTGSDGAWLYDPERSDEPAATLEQLLADPVEARRRSAVGRERARALGADQRARHLLELLPPYGTR